MIVSYCTVVLDHEMLTVAFLHMALCLCYIKYIVFIAYNLLMYSIILSFFCIWGNNEMCVKLKWNCSILLKIYLFISSCFKASDQICNKNSVLCSTLHSPLIYLTCNCSLAGYYYKSSDCHNVSLRTYSFYVNLIAFYHLQTVTVKIEYS